jgi:hypothetical protein
MKRIGGAGISARSLNFWDMFGTEYPSNEKGAYPVKE